jgi:hypothetical protein
MKNPIDVLHGVVHQCSLKNANCFPHNNMGSKTSKRNLYQSGVGEEAES